MMKATMIVVAMLSGTLLAELTAAQSTLPPVPIDYKVFLQTQLANGVDLMQLLTSESAPDAMSDADWAECRNIALLHVNSGLQRAKEESAAKARAWREELIRKAEEGQRIVDQCRAVRW